MIENQKTLICAECGKEIDEEETYGEAYVVQDNFLQIKYFETPEQNIFCSEECVLKAISAEPFPIEEIQTDLKDYYDTQEKINQQGDK